MGNLTSSTQLWKVDILLTIKFWNHVDPSWKSPTQVIFCQVQCDQTNQGCLRKRGGSLGGFIIHLLLSLSLCVSVFLVYCWDTAISPLWMINTILILTKCTRCRAVPVIIWKNKRFCLVASGHVSKTEQHAAKCALSCPLQPVFNKNNYISFSPQRPSFRFFTSLLPPPPEQRLGREHLWLTKSAAEWAQSAGVIRRGARRLPVKWVERAATPGPRLESRLARVSNTTPKLFCVRLFGPCTPPRAHSFVLISWRRRTY